jgi:hypothetical protein
MLPRNDENVNRRLRVDIPKRHAVIVLGDDLGRDFLPHDATEKT